MSKYERLRLFAIILVTDDKELFCSAYEKLVAKPYSIKGNNSHGVGVWHLLDEKYIKARNRKYNEKYLHYKPRVSVR